MLNDAIGGFSAGVLGTIIGYPLDTIKTRMQTSNLGTMMNVTKEMARVEGWRGFYKGVTLPLLSLTILNTLNFTSFNFWWRVLQPQTEGTFPTSSQQPHLPSIFLAGALAGPIASIISTPEHFIKTQMQIDNTRSSPLFKNGSLAAAKTLYSSTNSIRVFYIGHASNTLRESIFLGLYFTSYQALRTVIVNNTNLDQAAIPFAGGIAGALAWVGSFPLDNIKANVMSDYVMMKHSSSTTTNKPKPFTHISKSMITTGKKILHEKGVAGLYKGVQPSLIRAFLVSGSRFTAYEVAVSFMEGLNKP